MALTLRPYQQACLERLRDAFRRGYKAPLLVLPTAGGKTLISQTMLAGARDKGSTGWWLEHRKELIEQSSRSFSAMGLEHSVIKAGRIENAHAKIQIASVQTIVGRMSDLPEPDILFFDEAHHCAAESWRKIVERYKDKKRVGVTATPCRLDGRGLGEWFDVIVEGPSIRELIDLGFLADYRLFVAPVDIDTSALSKRGGDFSAEELYAQIKSVKRTGDIVEHYLRHAAGKRAILFACTIADSRELIEAFWQAGVPAAHLDGSTPQAERSHTFAEFEAGRIHVLGNCDLFGEGIHVPGVQCVIHGRPTSSLARYMQANGRGFAPKADGSRVIILDHAGNSGRVVGGEFFPNHGLPDENRDWSLEGKKKSGANTASPAPVRICPKCGYACPISLPVCPECEYEFPPAPATQKTAEGTLAEIDQNLAKFDAEQHRSKQKIPAWKRAKEEAACQTLDDFAALGTQRGYKRGWAWHRWQAKLAKDGDTVK